MQEAPTKEEREAMARQLEVVAAKLRDAEGVPIKASLTTKRPMEVNEQHMCMRRIGSYEFKCDIVINFAPGEWIYYDGASKDAPKSEGEGDAGTE